MTTYTATRIDTSTREKLRFRSLEALSRRLGGDGSYQVEHSETFAPPTRQVTILRYKPKAHASDVVARGSVPAAAVVAR